MYVFVRDGISDDSLPHFITTVTCQKKSGNGDGKSPTESTGVDEVKLLIREKHRALYSQARSSGSLINVNQMLDEDGGKAAVTIAEANAEIIIQRAVLFIANLQQRLRKAA
jgi:hypothetical protein